MIKQPSGSINTEPSLTKWTIYLINALANMLVNFDHGIVPAATKEIKSDLNLDNIQLGLLGSVVYCGLLVGSLAASQAFQMVNTKQLIFITIILYVLSLGLFLVTDKVIVLGISRTLVGFFQVFLVVYFPVWVDLHGCVKKTIWLTFLQLGVPLGVFFGYIITSIFVQQYDHWQYSFITQIALLLPFALLILLFSRQDLDASGITTHSEAQEDSRTYLQKLYYLYQNKIFLYTMLTLASLYFVVTGIQFWISDYMRIVLKIDSNTVFTSFSIISITAPTSGVLYGGIVLHKCGGYTGKNVLNICMLNGILASICAVPIPFINDFELVIFLLWFLLFFGGALMPAVMGLMISSVPKKLRAFANSTASLFHNLLGYLPAPFVYGVVNELDGRKESRKGMIVLMCWSLWGVVGLYLVRIYRAQEIQEEQRMIEEIENQLEINDVSKNESDLSKITEKESEISLSENQLKEKKESQSKRKPSKDQNNQPKLKRQKKRRQIGLKVPLMKQQSQEIFDFTIQQLKKKGKLVPQDLDFSKIYPKFTNYNQNQNSKEHTPCVREPFRRKTLALLTMSNLVGKTNSIIFMEENEEENFRNALSEQLKDIYDKYPKEVEMSNLK